MTQQEAAEYAGVDPNQITRWSVNGLAADGTFKGGDHVYLPREWRDGRYFIAKPDLVRFLKIRAKVRFERRIPGGVIVNYPHYKSKGLNRKIGHCVTTYVARQSCPEDCAFKDSGCYAEYDNTLIHWDKVSDGNEAIDPIELAKQEALLLDLLPWADLDVRLHVAGDSKTVEGTKILAEACERYMDRGGRRVWGYTHAWRVVPRAAWGKVHILASCESAEDVVLAEERGYATAIVAPLFQTFRAHEYQGLTVIPCPAQTHGDRTCEGCRLCMDAPRLLARKLTIGFESHGSGAAKATETVQRISLV